MLRKVEDTLIELTDPDFVEKSTAQHIQHLYEKAEKRKVAYLEATGGHDDYAALCDLLESKHLKAYLGLDMLPIGMTVSEFAHVFGAHDDDDQKDFRIRSHSCSICPADGGSCDKTTIGLTSLEKGKQPYYSAEGNAIRYKLCDKWKLYADLKRLMGNGIPPHCCKHRVGLTNYLPQTDGQTAALEWAKGYVKSFQFGVDGPVGRNMVIEGPVGTGKTHLAASILADVYYRSPNRRLSVKLVTAGEIARMFKTEQGRDDLSYKIMNTHVVVLDGLGSYTYNEETRAALEEAVAERRSKNLPFLLTAREPLYTYDAQLGSDVIEVLTSDMDTVVLDGNNWRETHRNIIVAPPSKAEPPAES